VSAWANWRLVIPELAESFRVIAPDQIGFNKTLPPDGVQYGRELWTNHALRLMELLEVDSYDVVGNSMGGAVAFSMAAAAPEHIGRIVAMGTMGVAAELPSGLDEVWGYQPSTENMRRLIHLFAYNQAIATDELVELRYRASIAPGIQEAFSSMFPAPRQRWVEAMCTPDDDIRRLQHRTLIIHGREDQVIPVQTSLRLMELIDNADLSVYSHCGHWSMIERNADFNRSLHEFLSN
jgi:pimeloyl-ACP methyl ester carboxylesterase